MQNPKHTTGKSNTHWIDNEYSEELQKEAQQMRREQEERDEEDRNGWIWIDDDYNSDGYSIG